MSLPLEGVVMVKNPPKAERTIEQWASAIQSRMGATIDRIIVIGDELNDAVKHFEKHPPEGMKNWKHAYGELLRQLNMSNQTAHQLRTISDNKFLIQTHNGCLPPVISTLSIIASMDDKKVIRLIKSGEIHQDTTKAAVTKLKKATPPIDGVAPKKKEKVFTLDEAHDKYLELGPKTFIKEVVGLVLDKKRVSIDDIITALENEK